MARLLQTMYHSQTINTLFILKLLLLIGSNTHCVYLSQHGSSAHRSLGALGRTKSMVSVQEQREKKIRNIGLKMLDRKVCMILEELELPYAVHQLEFSQVKEEHYVKLNPNGRLPTIKDPNTGITLWEVRTRSYR